MREADQRTGDVQLCVVGGAGPAGSSPPGGPPHNDRALEHFYGANQH
jgi:hypothetical protein